MSRRARLGRLVLPFLLALPLSAQALDEVRLAAVPALAVRHDGQTGVVHYIVIQINRRPQSDGPVVQFNEIALGGGAAVGNDWKDGVKRAVRASLRYLDLEGTDWLVTIKNRSHNALTEGMSASSAVAVGVLAAWQGDTVRPNVALTGEITLDGRILDVGQVPQKVEAAAREHFATILIPRGQLRTPDWDLTQVASKLHVEVVEVGTLDEAYRLMTGTGR